MHTIAVSLPSLSNFPCSTGPRGTPWAPGCGHGSEISIMARRQIACSPLPQACLALLQANSTSDQIEVAAHSGWRPLTGTGRKISHCPYGGNYRPSAQWRKGSDLLVKYEQALASWKDPTCCNSCFSRGLARQK